MKPCKKCGNSERYLGGDCKFCARAMSAKRYNTNRAEILAGQAAYRTNNPEKVKISSARWVAHNKEKVRANHHRWVLENKEKNATHKRNWVANNTEKHRLNSASWQASHPAKCCAYNMKRRAAKLQATPAWANEFFIEEIYDLAQRRTRATGFEWHVDHIVPLKSNFVCGLHCEANLRVIPAVDNLKKHNNYWPDMPEGRQ